MGDVPGCLPIRLSYGLIPLRYHIGEVAMTASDLEGKQLFVLYQRKGGR